MMPKSPLRKLCLLLPALLLCYMVTVFALADYLRGKPFVEKLGYIPSVATMRVLAADHKQLMSASLMLKVLTYYGALMGRAENQLEIPADYRAMSRTIDAALRLDPYNMDGYYFAQAILAWDVGKADLATSLLETGMQYRTWDWQLPFFAGFDSAFFLKDYEKAALYYRRAAELSGHEIFMNLAGRYLQQSGQTRMAISYLAMMERGARQESVKKSLATRRNAFIEVLRIEEARDAFRQQRKRPPSSLKELVREGFLPAIPRDPYGGAFYLGNDGSVSSTSGFAFAGAQKKDKGRGSNAGN